jgi:hypothetical protein
MREIESGPSNRPSNPRTPLRSYTDEHFESKAEKSSSCQTLEKKLKKQVSPWLFSISNRQMEKYLCGANEKSKESYKTVLVQTVSPKILVQYKKDKNRDLKRDVQLLCKGLTLIPVETKSSGRMGLLVVERDARNIILLDPFGVLGPSTHINTLLDLLRDEDFFYKRKEARKFSSKVVKFTNSEVTNNRHISPRLIVCILVSEFLKSGNKFLDSIKKDPFYDFNQKDARDFHKLILSGKM